MKISSDNLLEVCAGMLREMLLESETETGVFDVPTNSVVFAEWIESFDNGENIDALRSDLDIYETEQNGVSVELGRVNCWLLEEEAVRQEIVTNEDKRGVFAPEQPRGKTTITRTLRIFFFYQYGGGGAAFVRRITDRAIELFNQSPKLNFAPEKAQFFTKHAGLQIPLITEGDFRGTICYVRGCRLVVTTIEPL